MKKTTWPGNWKVVCDVCGMWYPSGEVKKRWDNLIVCKKDWEMRHPQDFIRGIPDNPTPAFVRPDPPDQFLEVCWLYEMSAYADLASADCAQADNNTYSYEFLLELKEANP